VDGADGEGVRFEGSGTRGGTCVGEGRVDGMVCDSDSAQAGGDAMVGSDTGSGDTSSGDTGSLGRAGVSGRDESGSDSGGADGIERGKTGDEGSVGVGDGCVIAGKDRSPPTGAASTGEGNGAGASHAVVAARPCCRWRR
jgi:hypothetical protein